MSSHNNLNKHTGDAHHDAATGNITHDTQASSHKAVLEYVDTVCQQIRWKKARPRVSEEITCHISDTQSAYVTQGLTQAEATAKAIADAGDAAIVGTQLDRVHRPKPQWGMLGVTGALVILGLAIYMYFNGGLSAGRIVFTGIGIAALVAAYFADFTWLVKYPKTLFFAVALGAAAVPIAAFVHMQVRIVHIHVFAGGTVGTGVTFPSHLALASLILIFPLVLAVIIFYARGKGYWGLVICGFAFALLATVAAGISVVGAARFGGIGVILLCIAIAKGMFGVRKLPGIIVTFVPTALLGLPFIVLSIANEFQRYVLLQRVMIFFDPSVAPATRGFWPTMTRGILREAAWFGRSDSAWLSIMLGPPGDPLQIQYLSVLTVLIGLMGWIAFVVIVGAMLFFIIKSALRCIRQKSSLGLLVSTAVTLTIAMQALDYVLFNLGFQMGSPISLPLVVSGNGALVINMMLIGFMLSVFRTGDAVQDKFHEAGTGRLISWENGRLIIDFKQKTGLSV